MEFLVCEFVAFGDRNDLLNRVLGCDRVNIELCLVTAPNLLGVVKAASNEFSPA